MPTKVNYPLVLPYNKTKQHGINPARTINMCAVNVGDKESAPALIRTPGTKKALDLLSGVNVRALFTFDVSNNLYAVSGQYVYKIDSILNAVLIGTIGTSSGYVSISSNNNEQVIFVDGTGGWVYNESTNVFQKITADGFPNPAPSSVTFMDGYFIANSVGTNQWQISGLNDGLSWDPTQNAFFQSSADNIIAVKALKTQLYIFGQKNTEVWVDQGQALFPFVRDNTMRFQSGCAAIGSVVQGLDLLFWLARDAQGTASVMMSNGSAPVAISTTDLDQEITGYKTVSDAIGYIYRNNGHVFYSLNFPSANTSWLYDVTSNFWVEQQMQDGSINVINCAANYNGKIYAGHYNQPSIYTIDQDYFDNDGAPINRIVITNPFVEPAYRAIRLNSLEIDMVMGQGNQVPPGFTPRLSLQVSYDRGITWGLQRYRPISKIGLTVGYRAVFRNLGINKDFCFRLEVYDPIDVIFRGAAINYDVVGN